MSSSAPNSITRRAPTPLLSSATAYRAVALSRFEAAHKGQMELYLNFEGHAETEESPNESYETHSPRGGATSQGQLAPKPATLVCAASYEAGASARVRPGSQIMFECTVHDSHTAATAHCFQPEFGLRMSSPTRGPSCGTPPRYLQHYRDSI